jgi:hypothetical protein
VQPCNQCELVPIHAAGQRTDLTRALLVMPSRSRESRLFWQIAGSRDYIILSFAAGRAARFG